MSIMKYTEKDFLYFKEKFQRRLYRQFMQYRTLNTYLESTIKEQLDDVVSMLGMDKAVAQKVQLKDHAEKTCLIGLKAEFELFFYVFCVFILNKILSDSEKAGKLPEQHEGILKCIHNTKEYYEDFVRGGFKNAKELFLNKAVPGYGLDRMVKFLSMCGLDMLKVLRNLNCKTMNQRFKLDYEIRPFSQVRTAFQVRHAIEHSFSRVGDSFIYKTAKDWQFSTWKRQFQKSNGPGLGMRIMVDTVDINATIVAMSLVGDKLEETWKHFRTENAIDLLQIFGE